MSEETLDYYTQMIKKAINEHKENKTSDLKILENCKYMLPCGWCEKRNMLCVEIGGKL